MSAVIQKKAFGGAELSFKDRTECESYPRMLHDWMVVEPLEYIESAIIHLLSDRKAIRGIVRSIGPGHYPWKYDHPDKSRRTKRWESKRFQPTELKVGDEVMFEELSRQTLYINGKLHLLMREADIIGPIDESH